MKSNYTSNNNYNDNSDYGIDESDISNKISLHLKSKRDNIIQKINTKYSSYFSLIIQVTKIIEQRLKCVLLRKNQQVVIHHKKLTKLASTVSANKCKVNPSSRIAKYHSHYTGMNNEHNEHSKTSILIVVQMMIHQQ